MSPRDRSPVRTSSPRQSSGKDHWNQWTPYTLTLLQLEQTAGSVWLSLVPPKVFFSILRLMKFCFLAAVASGLLSWGHFISSDIIDLIAQILFKLNWAGRCHHINNEMPSTENWVFNLVILYYWHTIFLFWYCAVALTQFVLLKALYK